MLLWEGEVLETKMEMDRCVAKEGVWELGEEKESTHRSTSCTREDRRFYLFIRKLGGREGGREARRGKKLVI